MKNILIIDLLKNNAELKVIRRIGFEAGYSIDGKKITKSNFKAIEDLLELKSIKNDGNLTIKVFKFKR